MTTEAVATETATPGAAVRRPGGVTFVVVLAYISFIFGILDGVLVIIDADTAREQLKTGLTEDQLVAAGIVLAVIGVIGILLTGALARGSNVVRILFGIWVALHIAGGLYAIVSHSGVQRGAGFVPVVLGIVIMYLLFNRSAREYFEVG